MSDSGMRVLFFHGEYILYTIDEENSTVIIYNNKIAIRSILLKLISEQEKKKFDYFEEYDS